MAKRLSVRREQFAAAVAAGSSAKSAYIASGYSKIGAAQGAARLLTNVDVQARVRELSGQVVDATLDAVIRSREDRIEHYQEIYRRLWRIVLERSADPSMAKIPGGKGGFIVRQIKVVGTGASQKIVAEYVVDVALSREIRGVLEQASKELGQWTERREITGKDGGPLSVEVLDSWLEESEGAV